jgi:hypothetical protein
MQVRNGKIPSQSEEVPAAQLASTFSEAQQRALEQRVLAEQLLAEARAVEERLAIEARQAHAAAQHAIAREEAAKAVTAAQQELEAITQVEAAAANLAQFAQQRSALDGAFDDARRRHEAATATLIECEERLRAAREVFAQTEHAFTSIDTQRTQLIAAHDAAQTDHAEATLRLTDYRAARNAAEAASAQAEERARAMYPHLDDERTPSLEPIEELRLLEARVALRAEAAKRAAERRAADSARNHVAR